MRMSDPKTTAATAAVCVFALSPLAGAQSLLDRPSTAPERDENGVVTPIASDGRPSLRDVSLIAYDPPEPRSFIENDLVTIIISERSSIAREQTVETEKNFGVDGTITALPDLLKLLELRYENYDRLPQTVDASIGTEFDGEGTYERDDTITARVTGRVVEVKPNGLLLIESKTQIITDDEEQVIVLSGLADPSDITDAGTIQSNQMADLIAKFEHEGETRRSTKKGLIPRVIETLFAF
jgi:flagellar L-ring protein precursor FlgH